MSDKNKFPRSTRGGVTRVKSDDGQEFEHDPTREELMPTEDMTGQPLASVGMSASVGRSTEYAREKYELSAWCTLPSLANEAAIKEAYEVAYEFCTNELERREVDVRARFFPEN